MRRNNLRELAGNRDFISGIYNYCDRWCERCPLTSRCLVYATEQADETLDDPEAHDINNARFWQRLESIFKEAREMIREWAEEAGVDLEAADAESALKARRQLKDDVRQSELSVSAQRYSEMVERWFEEEFAVEQSVHNDSTGKTETLEDDSLVTDAVEVVRWYEFFIGAKIFRSLMDSEDRILTATLGGDDPFTDLEQTDELDRDDVLQALHETAVNDADGSAKIALVAIDRSLSAWRIIQSSFPEKTGTIMPMLLELENLRSSIEQQFPNARSFIRPGFDEVLSEFVS